MKKILLTVMILTMSLSLMACSSGSKGIETEVQESTREEQVETKKEQVESKEEQAETKETESLASETQTPESTTTDIDTDTDTDTGEDKRLENFDVDKKAVVDYAAKIKTAMAEKSMEQLADLVSYPTYVGFPDGGLFIENKENFTALDPEKVFTADMLSSIEATDSDALEASMAGFTMAKEYKTGIPSITFSMVDGKLGITGINY